VGDGDPVAVSLGFGSGVALCVGEAVGVLLLVGVGLGLDAVGVGTGVLRVGVGDDVRLAVGSGVLPPSTAACAPPSSGEEAGCGDVLAVSPLFAWVPAALASGEGE
jgi:hypothetical protein